MSELTRLATGFQTAPPSAANGSPDPEQLIARLSETIDQVLEPLIPSGALCWLHDFPTYPNAGDSAIWVAEQVWVRRRGAELVGATACTMFSPASIRKRLGRRGIILLSGGGNFGDLYDRHQRLIRESFVQAFPDHRIIQLPQSIFFQRRDTLARAKRIFRDKPNITLLCRDNRSLEIARNEFRLASSLCPDMAFVLGPQRRASQAECDILWISRTDGETAGRGVIQDPQVTCSDWQCELGREERTIRMTHWLLDRIRERPRTLWWLTHPLSRTFDAVAQTRLRYAFQLLSRGKVVITDRLHGHVLSLLLGIPHVLLDNNYGKVTAFHQQWTADCPLTHWARSPSEALERAKLLLKRTGSSVRQGW